MNFMQVDTLSGNKSHLSINGTKTLCNKPVSSGSNGDTLCKICEKTRAKIEASPIVKEATETEEYIQVDMELPVIPENIMYLLVSATVPVKKSWARICKRNYDCPEWVLSLASH